MCHSKRIKRLAKCILHLLPVAFMAWQGKGSSYRPRRDESSYSSRNGRFRGDRDFREPRDYRAERPDRRKSR